MPRHDATSEAATRADFSLLRYAQCWEDTDVLLEALAIRPGDRCFSVASGGDNSLALLSRAPAEVIAVDLSPAQIHLVEMKAAGFRVLPHAALLEFVGVRPSARRRDLYAAVRAALGPDARTFWDSRVDTIDAGLAGAGKFERYLALFRRRILPLIHARGVIDALLAPRSPAARAAFYRDVWNNRRWRLLFRLFFSRAVMGQAGRDPSFFTYVEGGVAAPILARTEHALVDLDASCNPYVSWIVRGAFAEALPYVWRAENFEAIRAHLDRLVLRVASVESALAQAPDASIDRFNLSDIFEYVSAAAADGVFDDIARCGRAGGRAAYWNMLVARRRPERLAARLHALEALGERLHREAQTFFYSALHVDEIRA
jgi:S-adenosylmethionine-diacylglycerol 3-amino-3-carboxypropyl transferase